MKYKGSLILAVLTGASIALGRHHKKVAKFKKELKGAAKAQEHYLNVDAYYHGNAFSKLSDDKKQHVVDQLLNIIPKRDRATTRSFKYQVDVASYIKVLKYLCHRYEFHSKHAALVLSMPLFRVKRITKALIAQHLIKISDVSQHVNGLNEDLPKYQSAFVEQSRAKRTLESLTVHYHTGENVIPVIFNKALKNSVAENMYNE